MQMAVPGAAPCPRTAETSARQVVVVGAVRTAYGRRGGALAAWHPLDLSAEVLAALLERSGARPEDVGALWWGCASQVGAQSGNLGRRAVLAAGWPESVPGVTLDAHTASSAYAVHLAAQAVAAGSEDLVVAGGVESTSTVPLGAALGQPTLGKPAGRLLAERYRAGGGLLPPGLVAENVATQRGLGRRRLDDWALSSAQKAARAQPAATPYIVVPGGGAGPTEARGGRRGTSLPGALDEAVPYSLARGPLSALPPLYLEGGVVTAANLAAEGDGAAAVLLAEAGLARRLGLGASARLVSFGVAGASPHVGLLALAPATRLALGRAGLGVADVSRWYVLEASAVAVLAWVDEMGVDEGLVNPEGGELASTCPLGAAGAALFAAAAQGRGGGDGGGRYVGVCSTGEGGVATACIMELAR